MILNKKEIYLRHRVEKRNWEETYRQNFQSMTNQLIHHWEKANENHEGESQ